MAKPGKTIVIVSELVASVAQISVEIGEVVPAGASVALLESMKMEIPMLTDRSGRVTEIRVTAGEVVQDGDVLVVLEPTD